MSFNKEADGNLNASDNVCVHALFRLDRKHGKKIYTKGMKQVQNRNVIIVVAGARRGRTSSDSLFIFHAHTYRVLRYALTIFRLVKKTKQFFA